jgi:hypothetical protein
MKPTALALAVVVALTAAPARAEEVVTPRRGFLTGLGLGLLSLGLGGLGVGAAGVLVTNDANAKLTAFESPLPQAEGSAYLFLQQRAAAGNTLSIVGFVVGGLALAGGIVCLVLDMPRVKPVVTFAPNFAGGGTVVFSAQF